MFASSNRFGQPSNSSPFGTQTESMFGQTNNASNNPFAPNPSGTSTTPFGAQTGRPMFGAPQPSSPFGASSQPFGSSTPSSGASPAPASATKSSPFGGSFGSSTPQPSLFGSTTQQSQPPFGNSSFGSSTPFGASSTPAFGASSTPALSASNTFQFGSSSTHAFGASSTPFGASSSPAFCASPAQAFCSSGAVFSNNAFGCGGGVGGSNTSTFGASSTPAFGASKTPAFGVSSTPSFSFGSSPCFGQSTSAFGSGSSGSTQSPFGAQGEQASTPTFGGQSTSGVQQRGSRVMPYTPTTEADSGTGKLQSISAMSVYKEKNHGELRWEDYQRGDKGGKLPVGQFPGGTGSGVPNPQPSIFSPSPTFSQTTANPANPFSSSIATNSFAQKTSTTFPSFSSSFDQNTTPSTPSIVWSTTSSNTTSGFGPSPGFATTKSQPFSSTPAFSTGGNFNSSYSSPLFSSYSSFGPNTTPVFGPTSSAVAQTSGVQQGGSRVMPYAPTTEADSDTGKLQSTSATSVYKEKNHGKLQSISAMSVYKEKNHGELRWEDYQRGDKGGKVPVGRSPGGAGSGVTNPQPSIFSPSPTFSRTTANPENLFSSSIATNSFAQKASTTFPSFSSSFDQNTTPSIVWSTTSSNTTSCFGPSPGFAATKSQPFSLAPSHGSTPAFSTGGNFNNSYSSPLFSSIAANSSAQKASTTFPSFSSSFDQNTTPSIVWSTTSSNTTSVFGPSPGFATTKSQPFSLAPSHGSTPAFSTGGNFNNSYSSPLFSSIATNSFAQKASTTFPSFSSSFDQNTTPSIVWSTTSSNTTSVFGPSPGFAITKSQPFSLAPSHGSTPAFSTGGNFNNSYSSPLFSSIATNSFAQKASTTFPSFSSSFDQNTTPSIVWSTTSSNTTSVFGPSPGFATTKSQPFSSTPAFSTGGNFNNSYSSPLFSSYSSFGPNTTPVFGPTSSAVAQTNNLITPSTGYGNLSSSSSSLTTNISPFSQTTAAGLTPYPSVQPSKQPSGAFDFNNSGQTGNTTGVTGVNSVAMLPPLTNPFGTLPASPQISISQGGNLPSNQYGISSMPVVDKPAPVRRSPLLTSRNLLHRRDRLPTRKYRPDDDGPKVPFFSNLEENSSTPKASVLFSPRENPRALFIRPMERLRSEDPKDGLTSLHENCKPDKNNGETRESPLVKPSQKPNGTHENHGGGTNGSHSTSPSGVDIQSLMPKLQHPEYFTEPRIQELATKEKVDPGYCKRVKDFVVGRHGYGSIKFLGETDVSRLDLEMSVRFANREVNVYMDETKKPPVGQGLNKPALVTLLNIKCMDKKSGRQVKEGERLDKYKEMLKKKAEEQGAKFVFYDALNGVWTFKVEHF